MRVCVSVVTVQTQGGDIPQTLNPHVPSLLVMDLKTVSHHVTESKVSVSFIDIVKL